MPVQAVIFDFDLTLADSSAAIIECTEYALHRLDAAGATPAQIGAVIGLPLHEMFRLLTGETEPARADAFARHFVARADEIMVHGTRIYPDVRRCLRVCASRVSRSRSCRRSSAIGSRRFLR